MGAESFTVLAILEARDAASEIFAKVDESLDKFSDTAAKAADTARGAGDSIDDSLLKTASGADALELATARVQAAQEQATRTADLQATAERNLLEAHKAAAAAADDDTGSQYRLMEANEQLTATSKANAVATKDLAAAQKIAAAADTETVGAARAAAAAQDEAKANSAALASGLAGVGKFAGITALGLGVVGAVAVKAAGNFQSLTAHLVTDAGESAKNLQMVRAGILGISTSTGISATDITNAMYHIESAGIHAGAGLAVAKVAAEGAKVGGADLDTVSKTLVGTLDAYGLTSKNSATQTKYATSMMNELIATVGSGDMRMQDLASSLGSVTPLAAAAGLSFAQVGGAVATMTSQNMTAQRATQDLNNLLRNIVKPSKVASTEMRYLGLSANQVSTSLKGQGLTGVMNEFTQAILKNTQGGMVSLGFYKQMTPATQAYAQGILAGKVTTQDLTDAIKDMTPQQAQIITQFKAAAVSATGLKQTYTGALASLTGGATGLNTSLMITGKNAAVFADNVKKIGAEGKKASTSVDNWSVIQGTFNQKVDVAKTAVENTGIAIGSALLPAVASLFSMIGKIVVPIAEWTAKHKTLTAVLFVGVTVLATTVAMLVLVGKTVKAVSSAVTEVGKVYKGATAAVQKLAGTSKKTAESQKTDAETTAAVQEEKSAEAAAAQETDAAEVAAANDEAAVASQGSWVRSAAGMIGSAVKWVAQSVAKVAVIVASNVAGAAVTAGAWIAANALMLGGILLVVAAVGLAVYEIVTHWKTITAAVSKVWDDVFDFTKKIIGDVVSFIKAHWALIVGIFLGPIALVVALVIQHWKTIEKWFQDGVKAVEKALSWFDDLDAKFGRWIDQTVAAVVSRGARLIGWFTSLPGKVLSEVGKLATDLFTSGEHIIESLAHGIESAASGALHGAMGFVASTVKSFLPFSPAKQGPLSGAGDPSNSGKSIVSKLASGLTSGTSQAAAAAARVAGAVQAGLTARGTVGIGSSLAGSAIAPAVGSGGNGGVQIILHVTGNTVIGDSDIDKLVSKIGKRLSTTTLVGAGRKLNIRG